MRLTEEKIVQVPEGWIRGDGIAPGRYRVTCRKDTFACELPDEKLVRCVQIAVKAFRELEAI